MRVVKRATIDVRLTMNEYDVLDRLYYMLGDRGFCPEINHADQPDYTKLTKYLEFLPQRSCRTIVGELRDSNEIEMEGHSIHTEMLRLVPEGTWRLEITGTEEWLADIAKQLCSGSHFIYKGSLRNDRGIQYCVFAQLERPVGGEGSP